LNTKYNNWFDSKYYHILYKNRNHKEAKVFIKKLLKHINLNSYSKVLDAGCGKGRHSIEIEKLGHKVTGIDLSNNSIKFAKKFENSNLKFKVHDISKPLNTEFDVVLNLFTSFGYYEREKDLEILLSLEKNLKDNGIGVIDFLNIKTVKVNLVKDEQVIIDDLKFNIKRKINKISVTKEISFNDKNKEYKFKESVNTLSLKDFEEYFKKTNLEIIELFGDYDLNQFVEKKSPRLIIIFKKKSQSNK
jgi:2-polyprenyl-3-methyl-5-hydroxy-6-metoxy-1,4-benzoquinol methylase